MIAKLDRLARNVAFTAALVESGADFVACDIPEANRLTIHILAAVAEDEAYRISERTKAALAAYSDILPTMRLLRDNGRSLRQLVEHLNESGHVTRRGRAWNATQVKRVLDRAAAGAPDA